VSSPGEEGLVVALVVDRVERRTVLVVSALAMAGTCTAFAASSTFWPTAATSLLFGVFAAAYVPSLSLYLPR
jgi:predicted MFS family arabinose efflux permease